MNDLIKAFQQGGQTAVLKEFGADEDAQRLVALWIKQWQHMLDELKEEYATIAEEKDASGTGTGTGTDTGTGSVTTETSASKSPSKHNYKYRHSVYRIYNTTLHRVHVYIAVHSTYST